jgi:hypothetical protein
MELDPPIEDELDPTNLAKACSRHWPENSSQVCYDGTAESRPSELGVFLCVWPSSFQGEGTNLMDFDGF